MALETILKCDFCSILGTGVKGATPLVDLFSSLIVLMISACYFSNVIKVIGISAERS